MKKKSGALGAIDIAAVQSRMLIMDKWESQIVTSNVSVETSSAIK